MKKKIKLTVSYGELVTLLALVSFHNFRFKVKDKPLEKMLLKALIDYQRTQLKNNKNKEEKQWESKKSE